MAQNDHVPGEDGNSAKTFILRGNSSIYVDPTYSTSISVRWHDPDWRLAPYWARVSIKKNKGCCLSRRRHNNRILGPGSTHGPWGQVNDPKSHQVIFSAKASFTKASMTSIIKFHPFPFYLSPFVMHIKSYVITILSHLTWKYRRRAKYMSIRTRCTARQFSFRTGKYGESSRGILKRSVHSGCPVTRCETAGRAMLRAEHACTYLLTYGVPQIEHVILSGVLENVVNECRVVVFCVCICPEIKQIASIEKFREWYFIWSYDERGRRPSEFYWE